MNEMYYQEAMKKCSDCLEIGRSLERVEITQNACEAIEQLSSAPKLRIALVASNHSNAYAAVDEIFGTNVSASIPALDKMESARIHFTYGETENAGVTAEEGGVQSVYLTIANKLLEKLNLSVYITRKNFSDFSWKREISSADFVFLTVSAMQLFTQSERSFLQICTSKYVGAPRLALILADTDVINSEEAYNDLRSSVIWNLSAQGMNTEYFEIGSGVLAGYVVNTLLEDTEKLHRLSAEHISALCCEETAAILKEILKEADADMEALASVLETLKKRAGDMRSKGSVTANLAYGDICGAMTFNATQSIHNFCGQLDEEIAKTLETSEDVSATVELLPDYVENAVKSYSGNLEKQLDADSKTLIDRTVKRMEEDAGEFLGDTLDKIDFWLPTADINKGYTCPAFTMEQVDKALTSSENSARRKADILSKALLIGTIPAYMAGGFLAAGGVFYASRKIKTWMKDKIILEDKNNMTGAVHGLCSSMEQEMTYNIKKKLTESAENIREKIQDAYNRFVGAIMTSIQDKLSAIEAARAKHDQVEQFLKGLQNLSE